MTVVPNQRLQVLVVGEIASRNLGDAAIFVTLRHLLQTRRFQVTGLDLSRHHRVGPLDSLPPGDRAARAGAEAPGVRNLILQAVSFLPGFAKKGLVYLTKYRASLTRARDWRDDASKFDLVIFGGGALLMDNNWSFPLALRNMARSVTAGGGRYVCVGCSTGRQFSRQGKAWLREFLDGAGYIALRDSSSIEGLRSIGDYPAEVFADTALMTAAVVTDVPLPDGRSLGLNVMAPVQHPRFTRQAYEAYFRELSNFVEAVGEGQAGAWERIVIFSTGEPRDFDAARELAELPAVQSAGVSVDLAPDPRTLDELCATIAGCGAIVSSRMHAGVLAKSYRRPLVALGWDEKVEGFCETLGIRDSFVDIDNFCARSLVDRLSRIVDSGLTQSDTLDERLAELEQLPEQLKRYAGKGRR